MSMMSEFKSFAMRGNVVDMAVGIVIGGAFGKIVSSFVADVLMPKTDASARTYRHIVFLPLCSILGKKPPVVQAETLP